ncbi:MAG: hypothetical protein HLUCCA11_22190 [Phormidesmis priestleyi Ana]|uniref:Uncharacterized protein n=1 Tax=Phormidesmis priestleyi Ana TaxID=1666911 RepID=A0A0P7YPW4_9CYAN|nr:MAG: hypothetical protein HLUCCA11_22190 [Phormidesmis priestleyi Ana]
MAEAQRPAQPVPEQQVAEQESKRQRHRQIYQQYAAKFVGKSVYEVRSPSGTSTDERAAD